MFWNGIDWGTIVTMTNGVLLFFITLSFSLAIACFSLSLKLKNTSLALVQLYLAQSVLEELVANNKTTNSFLEEDTHTENFIKFLSDSREWAFDYIETSQKTIKEISIELQDQGLTNYADKLSSLLPDGKEIK